MGISLHVEKGGMLDLFYLHERNAMSAQDGAEPQYKKRLPGREC